MSADITTALALFALIAGMRGAGRAGGEVGEAVSFDAVDLFAGPGGWDQGAMQVGIKPVGFEWDHAACQTAMAAGHPRVRCNVADMAVAPLRGISGLIASPPCTLFSSAGTGVGKLVLDVLARGIVDMLHGNDTREAVRAAIYPVTLAEAEKKNAKRKPEKRWTQERVEQKAREDAFTASLVIEPARYIVGMDPEWIALEQVPEVLPLWQVYVNELRRMGYSAWTGVLNSANYGVPQTRERAIVMASRVAKVQPPEPTHSQHGDEGDLFGASRSRWVTMAHALGWGFDHPSCTVSAGGAEPFANAGYRRRLAAFVSAGVTGEGRPKDPETQPADTLTGKGTAYWIHERPATTVVGSFRPDVISAPGYRTETSRQNAEGGVRVTVAEGGVRVTVAEGGVRVTVAEGGVLQSFPADYPWQGSRSKQYQQVGNAVPPRLAAHVLAALTGKALEAAA